jgi:hypothetical protein
MEEIWKDIDGYVGYYQVSNLGNVRSVERTVNYELKTKSGVVIANKVIKSKNYKGNLFNTGYYCVIMSMNGKSNPICIHRLVAETFIPNPENKPTVNHKDGDKANNTIFNLEWATVKENNQHAFDTGLRRSTWFERFGADNPKSIPIEQYTVGNVLIKTYNSIKEAANRTTINRNAISNACNGVRETAGGYIWRKVL